MTDYLDENLFEDYILEKLYYDRIDISKEIDIQSVTKYLRLTLLFMWNSTLRETFNCYFSGSFCYYFSFGRGTGHYIIILWRLDSFLAFPKILSLKSFGNSWGNSDILCL